MSVAELLMELKSQRSLDWKATRERIHDEFDAAETENEREALLGVFQAVMDQVERAGIVEPENIPAFNQARLRDYSLLIVKECVVGENVCTQTLDRVTRREVEAGRMEPDHELRRAAIEGLNTEHFTRAELIMRASIKHGRELLEKQRVDLSNQDFDFMPEFRTLLERQYLVGVMWRFAERYRQENARDLAFVYLAQMLIDDGVKPTDAKSTAAAVAKICSLADGADHPILVAAYQTGEADGALSRMFFAFKGNAEVSGAPHRLIARSKPIAAILGAAACLASLVFGLGLGEALGMAAIVGGSTLAIALAIYRQMIKGR
jgi:hypothetical protein